MCKSESGVRQGCSLSSLLFNVYIRELGIGGIDIDETEEYKYLWVTVKGGQNDDLKNMVDSMKEANGVLGMVKCAASRSESKFVIDREGWRGLVVNKQMYG